MATDIADWTSSVVVQSGTVTISGTATVTISGTPSVNIANVPAVTVNSGTVSIGNTPSVVISGTPTVILGGGSASIGSISAIGSTVTVAGTINIGNTPAVSISGTPSVTISSGTVSIGNTPNINISAQSITVAVALPWASVGSKTTVGGGLESFTTSVVSSNAMTLGIFIEAQRQINGLVVIGHQSGTLYEQETAVVPAGATFTPITIPINPALDTTYDISWVSSSGVGTIVAAFATAIALGYPALGQNSMGQSVPVVVANDQTAFPVKVVEVVGALATYSVIFTANTTGATAGGFFTPLISIWHTNTSTKKVKLRRVIVSVVTNVNVQVSIQVARFTGAVPSAGTPFTPVSADGGDGAAEVSAQTLGNAGGGEVGISALKGWLGAIMAGSASDLFRDAVVLYEHKPGTKPLTLRAGVAEGWNIEVMGNVGYIFACWASVEFTEE